MRDAQVSSDFADSRFLAPDVLARIGHLELLARTVVEALDQLKMQWPKPKEDLRRIKIL